MLGAVGGLSLASSGWVSSPRLLVFSAFPLLLSLVFLLGRRRRIRWSLFLLGLGFPAVMFLAEDARLEEQRRLYLNQRVHLEGEVSGGGTFDVERMNNEPVDLSLYLSRETEEALPSVGGPVRVRVVGTVEWPYDSEGFGNYLRRQGYAGLLDPERWHRVEPVDSPERWAAFVREGLATTFRDWRPRWRVSVEFLEALVLGEKQALDDRILNLMHGLGLSHLFVISGLHVGLLFYVLVAVTGPPRSLVHGGFFLALLVVYLTFLGWPVPATRAGLMAGLWVLSEVFQRRSAVMGSFLTTLALLVTLTPAVLFDVGFQLSAAAMLGIFAVMPFSSRFRYLTGIPFLFINMGAFMGVIPVLLYHFGMVPRWGHLTGYVGGLVFPLFLLLLVLQVGLILTGVEVLADWGEYGFRLLLDGAEGLLHLMSPGVYTIGDVPGPVVLLLGLSMWCALDRRVGPTIQTLGVVLAVGMLVPVVFVGPTSSLVVGHTGSVPYMAAELEDPRETVLIVPPYREPSSFDVRQIEWRLESRGFHVVDSVYSDFSGRYWRRRGWTLPTGRFHRNWATSGVFRRGPLRWAPADRSLGFQTWNLQLGSQPPVGPTDPPGVVGRTNRGTWLLEAPDRLDDELYRWLLEEENYRNLVETDVWIYSDGIESTDPPPTSGYVRRTFRLTEPLFR